MALGACFLPRSGRVAVGRVGPPGCVAVGGQLQIGPPVMVPGGHYSVGLPGLARGGRVANEVNWKPALLLLLATGVWPGVG